MIYSTDKSTPPCNCRSVGECYHGLSAEADALVSLVRAFADKMLLKLAAKRRQGYHGWDDPAWTTEDIKRRLIEHVEKGDPVDIANFAAFLWNRTDEAPTP